MDCARALDPVCLRRRERTIPYDDRAAAHIGIGADDALDRAVAMRSLRSAGCTSLVLASDPSRGASDGTIYAIDGGEEFQVFVSEHGVMRWRLFRGFATDANGVLDIASDDGVHLFSKTLPNELHSPVGVSRDGNYEPLTALSPDEVVALDVLRPVSSWMHAASIEPDGSRFMLVQRSSFAWLAEGNRWAAFYGQPPTIAERRIVGTETNEYGKFVSMTLEVDGSLISVPVIEHIPLPAVPNAAPSTDRTEGFGNGLTFTCR